MLMDTMDTTSALFSDDLQDQIKQRFHFVDEDFTGKRRVFLDNAGGSFRLKSAVERLAMVDSIPDCSERMHEVARHLQGIEAQGADDARLIFNAKGGAVFASLTASGAVFDVIRAIAENVDGDNVVTSVLEHPSSFDAVSWYATRTGKELRVAPSNPETGGINVDEVLKLVDSRTCFLSIMYASNISGAKMDIEQIVRGARQIKRDLYIVVDAVQHAPHGIIDVERTPVDAMNIAPYKFFGCRGSGITWMSDRMARLPHHKLAAKAQSVWDLGSPAPAQFAVVTSIVDYVCWLGAQFTGSSGRRELFVEGMRRIELHERALLLRLLDGSDAAAGLRAIEGVTVHLDYQDLTKRDLIVAMALNRLSPAEAVREYEKRGVVVYERVQGSLYSRRMLSSFGITGAIRVSPLHCHSVEDIDQFLRVTTELANGTRLQATI
jgi:cysteine desulfurase / selenocysteine lyase